jgi:hypothetical protein
MLLPLLLLLLAAAAAVWCLAISKALGEKSNRVWLPFSAVSACRRRCATTTTAAAATTTTTTMTPTVP